MRFHWIVGSLLTAVTFAGCANAPVNGYLSDGRFCFRIDKKTVCTIDAAPSLEAEKRAKQFDSVPHRQVVWLVRHARFDAYGKISVSVNGQQIEMLPYTVARFVLPAGPVSLVARYKSRDISTLSIVGMAGEQDYVDVYADVGIFDTDFSLTRISEYNGQRKATLGKLIKDVSVGKGH